MRELRDKVVVVTGASSGIGRATAEAFARQGCRVVLAARREERLKEVAGGIEERGGQALVVPTDVGDREQVERLVERAVERFGRVDVMLNNAGWGFYATVEETGEEDMQRLWRVNFMGTFYGVQAALAVMRRQGAGHIMNVASVVGRRGYPYHGAYAATKFAVLGLTESLRSELAGSGIVATAVLPVSTRTEFFERAGRTPGFEPKPLGMVHSPERVAQAIVRCARRPRPEVLLVGPMRLGLAISVLFPGLADWVGGRYYRRTRKETADR